MKRIAFKMKLFEGKVQEYKQRHDDIWPELSDLLKNTGIKDFSIFLDEETNILFAYLLIDDPDKLKELTAQAIQKKWWTYMRDIMETNPDHSPVQVRMEELFYLR